MTKANKQQITKKMISDMISSSRLANAELKSFTSGQIAQNPSITGAIGNLTRGIILGDASNQRDGSQITVRHLTVRLNVRSTATSTLRMIIFSDMMCQGDPAVTDVLSTATWVSNYSDVIQNEQRRFVIHADKVFDLSVNGVMNRSSVTQLKFKAKKITYLGATDVNGAGGKGSMFILLISSTTVPFYDFSSNVRFLDQ
jgi:hypothetical protein